MYPNVHGITGTLCTLGTFAISQDILTSCVIGGVLAFISHDVMDRLGEFHYESTKYLLLFEGGLFAIFCYLALTSGLAILYFIGWFGGNLIDFIDKRLGLSIYNPKKYPYLQLFKCHKRKPNIQFTLLQTKLIAYIATIILILIWKHSQT